MSDSSKILVGLVGHPNCGKTALFNVLTGLRQKVANYPGVTVECVESDLRSDLGHPLRILDLPGAYSLNPHSEDERVTHDVLLGEMGAELRPSVLIVVLDATNLRLHLPIALEIRALGYPMCVALNMMDMASATGMKFDLGALEQLLGCRVVPTAATRNEGVPALAEAAAAAIQPQFDKSAVRWTPSTREQIIARRRQVEDILRRVVVSPGHPAQLTAQIDRTLLHPFWGPLILLAVIFSIFQAVFNLGAIPTDVLDGLVSAFAAWTREKLAAGLLTDLLVDGIISGVGAVVVFLPQILILFGCLLLLEDSGYMARAAFLMDRIMGRVGLSGRSVLPLVSGFACAVPAIIGARSIQSPEQRLATILVTPLMTCSARLPVYTLLIAAFIPNSLVAGIFGLQGIVLTSLYVAGALSAFAFAALLKSFKLTGSSGYFLLELPTYRLPSLRTVYRGLYERARAFLIRAGTLILSIMVLLWAISTFPRPPADATQSAIHYSLAGKLGSVVAPVLEPIGFNWKISVAMIPGFAAREVLVSALGTVYAVESENSEDTSQLTERLKEDWSLPTALALLAWYIFAPQCLATFAVMQRETRSLRWTVLSFGVFLLLAWVAAFFTFRIAGVFV
ncbi:MAG: ferrous iron transport protein B [Betaproteobacteria bacterium]|nr:ferrous iron transport protein B [Betaproteobacteria bacterium]